jgi:hypothetical protein
MSDETGPWERTLAEMDALAEELRAEGWTVRAVPAGATGVETRADSDTGRFGVVLVIPGDEAEAVAAAHEKGTFPRCEVYARTVGGQRYAVVRFDDPNTETCLLFAAAVAVEDLRRLLPDIRDEGAVYLHARSLDESHTASFEIGEPGLLVPEP